MQEQYEKLSTYAQRMGISYQTAWKWFKAGKIPNAKKLNNMVLVQIKNENTPNNDNTRVATYARISNSENKKNLEKQSNKLYDYATANGYTITKQIKEIGSGLNDQRPKLVKLLENNEWDILVIEHKDRLTRFGYNYIQLLVKSQGRKIVIINETSDKEEDILEDLVSIITSFAARIYGNRRGKRKTEKIIQTLQENKNGL